MDSENNLLKWLQDWYFDQCDEEWEHSFGIKIETLDNPGWSVIIDITDTYLEKNPLERVSIERSEDDWLDCSVIDQQFRGYGGAQNLKEILETFKSWATVHSWKEPMTAMRE
ncbi:MAG: immunity 53 family protein [Thermodesulfobacteriota bacterium]